jgi:hypothetical protein
MVYNLVSVKKVIVKVFTDLDLQEGNHRVSDMIEWAGEAMKKIGAFPEMITKVTGKEGVPLLVIDNFQSKLPVDLHTINQVAYGRTEFGPFYPMRYATGSFAMNHQLKLPYGTPQPSAELAAVNITSAEHQSTEYGTIWSADYTYSIVGGWIKCNLQNGFLLISYQAIPIDDDFYPLIPDDESFFEAIYWYINMKLLYPEFREGRVRDSIYYDAKSSWNYYRKQAYANAMMPNTDQLESIKNIWNRLVPQINEDRTFYSTMSQQDLIRDKNWR